MNHRVHIRELTSAVRVAMVVQGGKIMPRWFEQLDMPSRERILVKEVCYSWSYYEGAARIVSFAVNDGSNTYRLSLNTLEFTWTLGIVDM